MIDLEAIRKRVRDDECCDKCGTHRYAHRTDSLAACNRRLARQAAAQGDEPRTCGDPQAHHKFKPGGVSWSEVENDRADLLAYIDTLIGGDRK